jgi:hypothetical protein
MSNTVWEMRSVMAIECGGLLAAGWEPYAVTTANGRDSYHFRRLVPTGPPSRQVPSPTPAPTQ